MTFSEGEIIRARHVVERLQATLSSIGIVLNQADKIPVGHDAGNAVAQTALELAVLLAKIDAYQRAETEIDNLQGALENAESDRDRYFNKVEQLQQERSMDAGFRP